MTLDTRIYILDKVDPTETFTFCRGLVGATDRHEWGATQDKTWKRGRSFVESANPWTMQNIPGQGLPAWLMMYYRPNAPLRTPEQAAEHDSDCNVPGNDHYDAGEPLCSGDHAWSRACWLTISLDTAYGYSDERGYGCGDLHAEYVARLGQWLDAQGVRWEWMNEFTGEIHSGYDQLADLGRGGADASAWFRSTVAPAIAADIASRGGAS